MLRVVRAGHYHAENNLKPYQGLKFHQYPQQKICCPNAENNLKPYQGLKLKISPGDLENKRGKQPKTLSGIETSLT